MKILYIEDSIEKYMDIRSVLKPIKNVSTEWKTNLEEGLAEIKENLDNDDPYDVILTDMEYPMDPGGQPIDDAGFRLLEALENESIDIPVIIISSVNYNEPKTSACIWYNKLSSWQRDLEKALADIKLK